MFSGKKPEENVGEYCASKLATNSLPDRAVDLLDWPKLELDRLERNLHDIEAYLKEKRTSAERQYSNLNETWEAIRVEEEEFRQNFIKFNKFFRENYNKRLRAADKLEKSRELIAQRDLETADIENQLKNLTDTKTKMDLEVDKHRIYEEFLNEVQHSSNSTYDFKSINEIVTRYESYAATKAYLNHKHNENLCELENARTKMIDLIGRKSLRILGLYNQIQMLTKLHEETVVRTQKWETTVTHIRNEMLKYMAQYDWTKRAVNNIYVMVCKRRGFQRKAMTRNLENQLQAIKDCLRELAKVNRLCNRKGSLRVLFAKIKKK